MNLSAITEGLIPNFAVQMVAVPFGVGRFVMEWSSHERKIARLRAFAFDEEYEDVRDRLLASNTSEFNRALREISTRYSESVEVVDLLVKLLIEQEAAINNRHLIVHGFWEGHDDKGPYVKKMDRRTKAHQINQSDGMTLLNLAQGVHSMGVLVMRIENAICRAKGVASRWPELRT